MCRLWSISICFLLSNLVFTSYCMQYSIASLPRKVQGLALYSSAGNDVVGLAIAAATGKDESLQVKQEQRLDKEFLRVALPAFVSLTADPLASIVDAIYVGKLGPVEQAAMGIAISAQYSVAKLYNDPMLKSTTSLVANKKGADLEAAVATAVVTASVIGLVQTLVFLVLGKTILRGMGVGPGNEMLQPAVGYLFWRALGVPAATLALVTNGIFRGRGDTATPLLCSALGLLVNVVLDPILIFHFKLGCAGAGAATAVSQWVSVVPLVVLLHRAVPIRLFGREKGFFKAAFQAYLSAAGHIFLRTLAKVSAYTVTAGAAARLGTVSMAAYSLTFNLGFATSQLCESISIATQVLLAREVPFKTPLQKQGAAHTVRRSMMFAFLVSSALSITTHFNLDAVLAKLSSTPEVQAAAAAIMPVVLLTQLFKGFAYSTGGILLGGMDWAFSSLSMQCAALVCVGLVRLLPLSLWNIWVSLAAFMATQVLVALSRFLSNKGPWAGVSSLLMGAGSWKRGLGLRPGFKSGSGSGSGSGSVV